jgi:uncharacterized protein
MSAAANKKLMENIFARIREGDRSLFAASLADDVTMTVTGQYSWSQTFRGREAVLRDLYCYVRSLLKAGGRCRFASSPTTTGWWSKHAATW